MTDMVDENRCFRSQCIEFQITPPRIGILAADLTHKHGWAHYGTDLIAALRRAGVEVKVLAAGNSPILDGVEVLPILPTVDPLEENLILKLITAFPKALVFLRNCDVIHSLVEPYAPLGAWLAGRRPFFITGHGSYVQTIAPIVGRVSRFIDEHFGAERSSV